MKKPLDGVTVLDFTQAFSGPYCTLNLAGYWRQSNQGRKTRSRRSNKRVGTFKKSRSGACR